LFQIQKAWPAWGKNLCRKHGVKKSKIIAGRMIT
jgi:hypothetical protein